MAKKLITLTDKELPFLAAILEDAITMGANYMGDYEASETHPNIVLTEEEVENLRNKLGYTDLLYKDF